MILRPARPEDAATLGPFHVRCWQEAYQGIIPEEFLQGLDPVTRTDRFARLIADDVTDMAVVEDEAELAGFISFGPAREVEGIGEVYAIYVGSDFWGRGFGSALLRGAQDRLASEFDRAMLWVLTDNTRARAFYERHGWRATGDSQYLDLGGSRVEELRYDRLLR